jgi:Uma2 family endonuclease
LIVVSAKARAICSPGSAGVPPATGNGRAGRPRPRGWSERRSRPAGTYPDLVAFCAEPEFQDGRHDVLLNPSLTIEVFSHSTEAYDRGGKFALYRQIPSLREYLLTSQHQAQVDLYTGSDDDRWTLVEFTALTHSVPMGRVDCTLALAEVYGKVGIGATEKAHCSPDRCAFL